MSTSRDYYADLELPPSADVQDVRKQFRKLALKYHPDRNPGREQEVNEKFQVIQSAHEVLSDPQQKSKYDASRARNGRTTGASGVRGNPWSNAGSQYPPPPRRSQPTRTTPTNRTQPTGAQRWSSRFASGVPPTAKQNNASDAEAKKNAAKAFENMRKTQAKPKPAEQPRPTPPPPPPRSESAKQRAEASFGSRKNGFHPRSAMYGDEPPVTSHNYSSRPASERYSHMPSPNTDAPPSMPDPLAQFRDKDNYDPRQSTPYSTHGGEKFDPFDGIQIGRTKSTRETGRQNDSADEGASTRDRSASMPKDQTRRDDSSEDSSPFSGVPPEARPKAAMRSRASQKYTPSSTHDTNPPPRPPKEEIPSTQPGTDQRGPSMYATRSHSDYSQFQSTSTTPSSRRATYTNREAAKYHEAASPYRSDDVSPPASSPSGDLTSIQLTSFERKQQQVLAQLIQNAAKGPTDKPACDNQDTTEQMLPKDSADDGQSNSFSFPVDDDTFDRTSSPEHHQFTKTSTDDINTSFARDEDSGSWQFNAGGGEQSSPTRPPPRPAKESEPQSPPKRPEMPRNDSSAPSESGTSDHGFNPHGWNDKFQPDMFVPQPGQSKSASPTRPIRRDSRKPKTSRTAGNATIVEDSSSEDEIYQWRGRKAQGEPAVQSPQAMDIDSPPAGSPAVPGQPGFPARNIHVEPSRPEWRPGNVDVSNGDSKLEVKPSHSNLQGSEDSEEFQASFADLKNVPPFAQQGGGAFKLGDLRDQLPFESKASAELPINLPKVQPLDFPAPPAAPQSPLTAGMIGTTPSVAAWQKYVHEFEQYLQQWDAFNSQVVDHFASRKTHIAKQREAKGYTFLETRSDAEVQEYYAWLEQDIDVRRRWSAACEEHEQRFREFMACRIKMK